MHTPGGLLPSAGAAEDASWPVCFGNISQVFLALSRYPPLSPLRVAVGPSPRRFSAAPRTSSGEEFCLPSGALRLWRRCSNAPVGMLTGRATFCMWRRLAEALFLGGTTSALRTHPIPAHASVIPPSEEEPP